MKLKSIRIIGMHNVVDKTYDINSVLTYFKGPNGSGKSTVLEAIQLVLLGYIPGYAKTNEGIMKHSSGKELQVIGTFDNGSVVVRKWTRVGSSVSSTVQTIPALENTKDLKLIDDVLELPIYNFNDFKDLTANKMKEWFLSFLPSEVDSIDWREKLTQCLGDRTTILNNSLLESVLSEVTKLSGSYKGLELVQNFNTYLKTEQAFNKKEITRLESTIQSLIHYDEELPESAESVKADIAKYMQLLSQLSEYESKLSHIEAVKNRIASLKVGTSTDATSLDEIEYYVELRNTVSNLQAKFDSATDRKDYIDNQLDAAEKEYKELTKIHNSICPYTSKPCAEIQQIVSENQLKLTELKITIEKLNQEKMAAYDSMKQVHNDMFAYKQKLEEVASQYNTYFQLKDIINSEAPVKPTDLTRDDINNTISGLQESLSKIEANNRYAELIETITKDKFNVTNDLEVLKMWVSLTDANGLQTELMRKPFENLADDMNTYLSKMFGKSIVAKFNLTSKANSFSFGLVEDEKYIEFDYLSSGERCLFMLALMICIMDKSNAKLRTILVDDLIDHLDDSNAQNVFEALEKVEDVQFILAGVKACNVGGVVDVQL